MTDGLANRWARGTLRALELTLGPVFLSKPVQAVWARLPINTGNTGASTPARPLQLAVVAHIYYPDVVPEVVTCWRHVATYAARASAGPVTLHITTVDACAADVSRALISIPEAVIHVRPNRGRDIAPFLHLLQTGVLDDRDAVLKLHSKKSPHLRGGDLRRRLLFALLAGNGRQVARAARQFDDPATGLVGWRAFFRRTPFWWMSNQARVRDLATRADPPMPVVSAFFEGTMFWVRPSALAPLHSLALGLEDFEVEAGQTDGALHHAVERLFAPSVWAAGCQVRAMSGGLLNSTEGSDQ